MSTTAEWFQARLCSLFGMSARTGSWNGRFRSLFGVSFQCLLSLWDFLQQNGHQHFSKEHVLWALYFLKVYPIETVASCFFGATEKTWRKWVVKVVHAISELELVYKLALDFQLITVLLL